MVNLKLKADFIYALPTLYTDIQFCSIKPGHHFNLLKYNLMLYQVKASLIFVLLQTFPAYPGHVYIFITFDTRIRTWMCPPSLSPNLAIIAIFSFKYIPQHNKNSPRGIVTLEAITRGESIFNKQNNINGQRSGIHISIFKLAIIATLPMIPKSQVKVAIIAKLINLHR